jgi:hypothetical protein
VNKCPVSSFLQLGNISSIAVVTVTLPGNRVRSIYGTLAAETTNTTFLFDRERPEVQLSTIAPAKTKSHIIPVLIQFTEPVFLFNSSGVTISGGNLTRQAHKFQTTPLDMLTACLSFCCILPLFELWLS